MKLDFDWADDGQVHAYCIHCHQEATELVVRDDRQYYRCRACGQESARQIVIDPQVMWWTDETGEYWHEAAGVFVANPVGHILLFERTKFPFNLTVPAGHVAPSEMPEMSAARELMEEVGLRAERLLRIATDDIVGDQCRRGSDVHRWHSFGLVADPKLPVTVHEEGMRPVWLSLDEAAAAPLTPAVRYVLEHHRQRLERLVDEWL